MNNVFKVLLAENKSDFLTFTSVQNGSTISLNKNGNVDLSRMFYKIKKVNWSPWQNYIPGTSITLNNGEKIRFWNKKSILSRSINDCAQFSLTGLIQASGNVMSMLNFGPCDVNCFIRLFYNCSSLTKAPDLPATNLAPYCYYEMFRGCSSLTQAPELPATNLYSTCYGNMFRGCSSLTQAPDLPATILADTCYYAMFRECSSLTQAPDLPATILTDLCYYQMFLNCSSLNKIKVNFTAWNPGSFTNDPTFQWFYGGSSSGTFTKPSSLPAEIGVNRIPTGWTIVNI